MIIKSIQIKNYKSFKDSGQIEINETIQSFVGQNNTGKSAILDAIQCFFEKDKKITEYDFHKQTTDSIEIDIGFSNISDDYIRNMLFGNTDAELKEPELKKLNDFKEKMGIENESIFIKMISDGKAASKYVKKDDSPLVKGDVKKILPELKIIPAIRDPKSESTGKNKSYLSDLLTMIDDEIKTDIELDGKNITYKELNRILETENDKRCKEMADHITKRYSNTLNSSEIEIRINSKVDIAKGTEYSTKIYNTHTKIESDILDSGTGYQSMIILSLLQTYVDITKDKANYILLIEEPEVYLHPSLQRKMIDTLIEISQNNQVLFTTHSPITLSNLKKENIKVIEKHDGQAKIQEASTYKIINELGIKPDDIFYSQGIIFVEGKDDQILINKILSKINSEVDINVIETNSCENLKFFASAELLLNKHYKTPVLIIRDSDGADPDKLLLEISNSIGDIILTSPNFKYITPDEKSKKIDFLKDNIHILEKYALEDYFINNIFLDEFYEISEDLINAIECYNCKYRWAMKNPNQSNNIPKYFQPKRFIKGYPDVASAFREANETSFNEKWLDLKSECDCERAENGIDNFLEVRENLIKNINQIEKETDLSYIDYILGKDLDTLMKTDINELIDLLKKFIEKCKN